MRRLPPIPLFLQTLGLVIATLVSAQIAAVVIVFSLPRPAPEVYSVEQVIAALRGQAVATPKDDRPLAARISDRPPVQATEGRRRLGFRDAVARALGLDPERIVIGETDPRFSLFPAPRSAAFAPPRPRMRRQPATAVPGPDEPILFGRFALGVRKVDGRWLVVRPNTGFGIDPWQRRLLLVSALAALGAAPLAWAFSRRLAAPFAALAEGAQRLGRDPHAAPLDIPGSAEVTSAVISFNEMQERLRLYVEDRTAMVGAIAHDLRTPLTRLRFRIEAAPDELRRKLAADIDQMDAMISAALGFVRDVASPEQREPLELASLVETVVDEAAETGADAAMTRVGRVVVDGDSLALTRMTANVVENAIKFGTRARGAVFAQGEMAVVEIDDDGPGVATADMERVFEPFRRLESSRNRKTGGIGLGLAVVRAVARSHGGDVTLINRPQGGLTVRITLPRTLSRGVGERGSRPARSVALAEEESSREHAAHQGEEHREVDAGKQQAREPFPSVTAA